MYPFPVDQEHELMFNELKVNNGTPASFFNQIPTIFFTRYNDIKLHFFPIFAPTSYILISDWEMEFPKYLLGRQWILILRIPTFFLRYLICYDLLIWFQFFRCLLFLLIQGDHHVLYMNWWKMDRSRRDCNVGLVTIFRFIFCYENLLSMSSYFWNASFSNLNVSWRERY